MQKKYSDETLRASDEIRCPKSSDVLIMNILSQLKLQLNTVVTTNVTEEFLNFFKNFHS